MGDYPPHGTVPGGVTRPGNAATDGETAISEAVRKMGLHLGGGGERGDGL